MGRKPTVVAEPPKITWISALTIIAKATLIQLARTSAVPRVKSRLKPQKNWYRISKPHTKASPESTTTRISYIIESCSGNLKLLQTNSESKIVVLQKFQLLQFIR